MSENKTIENLEYLFKNVSKLKIPAYQRAYAWKEEQLDQFVSDMLEMKEKGGYYYGHFIFEKSSENLEIIDGQQRITTFILFLLVCRSFKKEGFDDYINKFETVDYDKEVFEIIINSINDTNIEWVIENFNLSNEPTLSIQRVVFALNRFRKLFKDGISKLKLDTAEIDNYVKTLTQAHISKHITDDKAVAVQIFELQNTRGIKLNLIEKVKSKLMKAVYLNANIIERDLIINDIQNSFAEIYRLEETVSSNAFRGELSLDEILLHHLRIIDDGTKLTNANESLAGVFNSPSKSGDREENILKYIGDKIVNKQNQKIVEYIKNLVTNLQSTVKFVSKNLPDIDKYNHLIGDVMILDKNLSLEFFILLFHKGLQKNIENEKIVRTWEKFLFIRDFHDKYYRLRYTDDFSTLFHGIAKSEKVEVILDKYVIESFRPDYMEGVILQQIVSSYIEKNKEKIIKDAFVWWTEKMVYILYKYEIMLGADCHKLRYILKFGRSVEHILPQTWQWQWIDEKENAISDDGKIMNEKINSMINGIGNLLLITPMENSSVSNKHPKDKVYTSCDGGSYHDHNENRERWGNYNKWEELITQRGEKIFEFLKEFIA
jgi:uncharacterized protein with ParB-like and HNH nuclease domain